MSNNYQRTSGRLLFAACVAVSGILLAGCSSGSGNASAADSPSASPTGFQKALAYAKCMRDNGVTSFQDPKSDGSGHVMLGPGSGVDPNSPTYQKAAETCQPLQPQAVGGGNARGGNLSSAKVAAWAKCIRAHGVPNLQDPKIQGNTMIIDPEASGITNPGDFQNAMNACQDKNPGGGLLVGGGPQ